jgi:hypothetical protein
MNMKSEYDKKEFKNKSNNLTYKQIVSANFSKIKLCDLIVPYFIISDWYDLEIYFSETGIIASQKDFKRATDLIYNCLLYN